MKLEKLTVVVIITICILFGCEKEGPMGPAGPQGQQGTQGPAGSSELIGFASFDGDQAPSVYSYGGNTTTSVTITRVQVGVYVVSFYGNFESISGTNDITVLSSASNIDYLTSIAESINDRAVNSSRISIRLNSWGTNGNRIDTDFSVAIISEKY